jgi:CHAD domain-containing protein
MLRILDMNPPGAQDRTQALFHALFSLVAKVKPEVSPKQVHRLRTTIRRIESLLTFVSPDLSRRQKVALEELGSLRKRAGKVRDLDVQIGLLREIANGSTAGDRHALEQELKYKRERQAKRLASEARELKGSRSSSHLMRLGGDLSAADIRVNGPIDAAEARLSGLRSGFDPTAKLKTRRLHALRIELKLVRYLAEADAESPRREALLESLKSIQDAMGTWHDWEQLRQTAAKYFRDRNSCPLVQEIRALYDAKRSAAVSAVTHFLAETEQAGKRKSPRSASAPVSLAQRAG